MSRGGGDDDVGGRLSRVSTVTAPTLGLVLGAVVRQHGGVTLRSLHIPPYSRQRPHPATTTTRRAAASSLRVNVASEEAKNAAMFVFSRAILDDHVTR